MRKLSLPLILILLFISSHAVFGQNDEWYLDKPITEIKFEGLINISASELEGVVNPFIGQRFTDTLFWDLQSRLFALDYFEEFIPNAVPANPEKTSVIIEFSVTERPVVQEIKLSGNNSLRRNELLEVILLKTDDIVTRTKVRLDSEAIKNLYTEKGYPDVQVQGTIEKDDKTNSAIIIFNITEGSQSRVKSILFSGNNLITSSALKGVMKTKEQSFFFSGVFQESKLQEDLLLIQAYYRDRGYVDARIVDITREVEQDSSDNKNYLIITIFIEEGNQYTFGGIDFVGNQLFTTEKLQSMVRLSPGSILNMTRLETDYARVADAYYNEGYIFNIINLFENRDEISRTIRYTINIVEKGRAHIENIIITGNTKTEDYVILRELPFQEGDIFSTQKIREGIYNLQNLQFFSNIGLDYPQGSAEGLMDLILTVEEGRTLDLNFGVTFTGTSGEFPITGFVTLSDKNFLGRGQELSVGTTVSAAKQDLSFGFKENWIGGRRWSGGVELTYTHEKVADIAQDIIPPLFYDGIPDPYDGHYVFSEDTTYNGTDYAAGTAFPGTPSPDEINDYNLVTDYKYADYKIPSDYLMSYDSHEIALSLSTGYTFHTPVGRIGLGTGGKVSLKYIVYDEDLFRPANPTVRENNMVWQPISRVYGAFSWDTRDIIYNPSKGFYLKETLTYTGGILPSTRQFIRNTVKGEAYFTLFDVPVFKDWNFKMILALRSTLSLILNQSYPSDYSDWDGDWTTGVRAETTDLLYVDGMILARGWNRLYDLKGLWDNWIELRMPIMEQLIWADFFLSGTAPFEEVSDISSLSMDNFLFSFGAGGRLAIPQLPIGLYFVKRFKFTDSGISWQQGSILPDSLGLDFVISFNIDLF